MKMEEPEIDDHQESQQEMGDNPECQPISYDVDNDETQDAPTNIDNIPLELLPVDVKNITPNRILMSKFPSIEDENDALKKELIITQEKFSLLQMQVQHQDKLIELLCRLDMQRSGEAPDEKEVEDLQSKIQIVSTLVEELNIKFNEICSEKRRFLITGNTLTGSSEIVTEKKAAIWDHFTVSTGSGGQKFAECNFCKKIFNCRSINANKCREHIYDKCADAPEDVKKSNKPRYDPQPKKTKYHVWEFFLNQEKDGKSIIVCSFCGIEYSSRNATKCREHLAFKCPKVPSEPREKMKSTFSQEYINSLNTPKRSSIWEHFSIIDEDDKSVIQCIYCCVNYANKNATKCREHLLERCDKIPLYIRHKINHSFFESPLKTWTQIKIPIWEHFSIVSQNERNQYKCNYCKKLYSSKNVTKFRAHLLEKCESIPDDVKAVINSEVISSSMKSENNADDFYGDDENTVFEDENMHANKQEREEETDNEDEENRIATKRLKMEPEDP